MAICLRQPRWIGWEALALTLALAWITAGPAQAGILASDPNAMSGWQGSVTLSAARLSYLLSATVDYAVYVPGSFDLSFPGSDPSNNTSYVYAYEIFDSAEPTSTEYIKQFSVGLHGGGPVANQGDLTPPIGPAGQPSEPPGFGSAPTSAVWSYSGLNGSTNILPGQNSEILFFTSPDAPGWDYTSLLASHGLAPQTPATGVPARGNAVPSPTPEPATMLLLATAACLFGLLGVVRRRSRD